jgi:hypothetical protein
MRMVAEGCPVIVGMLHGCCIGVSGADFAIGGAFVPVFPTTGETLAVVDVYEATGQRLWLSGKELSQMFFRHQFNACRNLVHCGISSHFCAVK